MFKFTVGHRLTVDAATRNDQATKTIISDYEACIITIFGNGDVAFKLIPDTGDTHNCTIVKRNCLILLIPGLSSCEQYNGRCNQSSNAKPYRSLCLKRSQKRCILRAKRNHTTRCLV